MKVETEGLKKCRRWGHERQATRLEESDDSWEWRSLCQPLMSPLGCGIQFMAATPVVKCGPLGLLQIRKLQRWQIRYSPSEPMTDRSTGP